MAGASFSLDDKDIDRLVTAIKNYEGHAEEALGNYFRDEADEILEGLPYVDFPKNLEIESGFFVLLDFTQIKIKQFLTNQQD